MADKRRRHDLKDPDTPVANRGASSVSVLCERVKAVAVAWRAADEDATRAELAALSAEAALLARAYPLLDRRLSNRQRVAAG